MNVNTQKTIDLDGQRPVSTTDLIHEGQMYQRRFEEVLAYLRDFIDEDDSHDVANIDLILFKKAFNHVIFKMLEDTFYSQFYDEYKKKFQPKHPVYQE